MNDIAACGGSLYWHNCYSGTYDLIHGDSMAHPAKMSPALCYRILKHLQELGLLKEGDQILDPMAGTGITNICAGAMGYGSVSVELEDKFVGFQQQNKEYAERRLYKALDWQMIKGDSRRLSELLGRDGLKSITSPPYYQAGGEPKDSTIGIRGRDYTRNRYGETAEQIGNLKDTPLKAITSPPYADNQEKDGGIDWEKAGRPDRLKPSSKRHNIDGITATVGYGKTEGQIGALADKPLKSVMSPPYDGHPSASNSDLHPDRQQSTPAGRQYGDAGGQIGKEQSESYLEAMAMVYSEIAKVSDVLTVVIKNPTRGGKLRRLDLDTIKILELAGWSIHCQHRALLFEELEQVDLFGGSRKRVKGRLSFFKRLSWQNGQPVASWEDIIICTRNGDR